MTKHFPIVNIRGPNGAGKTTLATMLAGPQEARAQIPFKCDSGSVDVEVNSYSKIAVLGGYPSGRNCGGMDRVKKQLTARRAVYTCSTEYPVVFEGVLISTIYGPWLEMTKHFDNYLWVYLLPELDVCLERIYARNGGKAINEKLVKDKCKTIYRTMVRARNDGQEVWDLTDMDPVDAANKIERWINERR